VSLLRRTAMLVTLLALLGGCTGSPEQDRLTEENSRLTEQNVMQSQEIQRLRDEVQRMDQEVRTAAAELDRYRDLYTRLSEETAAKRLEAVRLPANLINAHYSTVVDEDWTYRKYLSADLDDDGTVESVLVTTSAGVDPKTGQVGWDDGHLWRVYVEEPKGQRTLIFSDWVQLGRLEVFLGERPSGLLLQRAEGVGTVIYQVAYRGPQQVEAHQLFGMTILDRAAAAPDSPILD